MQRQTRLREKIDGLRERIRELELKMHGIDSTNMNVQTLEPIAAHFQELIHDVMGRDVEGVPDWKWNLGYVLDYDKVLDYVMHRESSLIPLESLSLFMLQIPLDIIDVWIQFVRMLCGLSSMVRLSTAQRVNEQLNVVEQTVDIMRSIVVAAQMNVIGPTLQHKSALSTYGHNIIADVRVIIDLFPRAKRRLSNTFFEVNFFFETMHTWDSFRNIDAFIRNTFIDKVEQRLDELDEQVPLQENHTL